MGFDKKAMCLQWLLLLGLFICQGASAQTVGRPLIKGFLKVDKQLDEQGDTISLFLVDAGTGKLLVTGKARPGKFSIPGPFSASKVVLKIIAPAFEHLESSPFDSPCDTCSKTLDTFFLKRSIGVLREVIVKSDVNLIKEDPDKLTYLVESDPDATNLPLLEIMRKIPMVNVVGNESIDVGGKPFLVLVNGKNSGLFKQNVVEVMRSFPAKLVKRIEVITNPSAKYDAEGVGAVINVVLAKKKFDGYNASVGPAFGSLGTFSVTGLVTAKAGNLGYNGYIAPTYSHLPQRTVSQDIHYQMPAEFVNNQYATSRNLYRSVAFNNELSWEADSLNLITVGFSNSIGKRKTSLSFNSRILDKSGGVEESYISQTEQAGKHRNPSASFSYQRSFRNMPDKLFSVLYLYDNYRFHEDNVQDVAGKINYPSGINRTGNNENEQEHTVQVDYAQPLWGNTLEAGMKSIFRRNKGVYYFDLFNPQFPHIPTSGIFRFNQSVHAGYLAYGFQLKSLSFRLGLRGEWTNNTINDLINQDYFNLIPTGSVSLKAGKKGMFKLSYSRRLERPGVSYLNPFVDITNSRFLVTGNPTLDAERANSFELAYSLNKQKISWRTTLTYLATNNGIEPVTSITADSLAYRSYYNIGKSKFVTLNQFFSHKMNAVFSQVIKANLYYREYSGSGNLGNSGWAYSGDYTLNFRNKHFYRATFNIGYLSSVPGVQGMVQGRVYSFLSMGKELLNRKLYVGCTFRNFFPAHLEQRSTFAGDGFYQVSKGRILQRNFQLNVNFSFGQLKERVGRPEKSIENEDKKKIERKEANAQQQ